MVFIMRSNTRATTSEMRGSTVDGVDTVTLTIRGDVADWMAHLRAFNGRSQEAAPHWVTGAFPL